jgi:hypothetical protein
MKHAIRQQIAKIIFEKCSELGIEEAFGGIEWDNLPPHHALIYYQIAAAVEQHLRQAWPE